MTTTALPQTEAEFQQAVVELARLQGWLVYFTHDSRHSPAGFPDLVLVRDDRLLFVELKAENGVLSGPQSVWIAALNRVQATTPEHIGVRIWRPSDWFSIEQTLKRRGEQ